MPTLLEIRDLRVCFDTDDGVVQAVTGVSLRLERGRQREQQGDDQRENLLHVCAFRFHLMRQFQSLETLIPRFSNAWKFVSRSFPIIGNSRLRFSNDWKSRRRFCFVLRVRCFLQHNLERRRLQVWRHWRSRSATSPPINRGRYCQQRQQLRGEDIGWFHGVGLII